MYETLKCLDLLKNTKVAWNLELWKFLNYKMHYHADVEDYTSRQNIIKSLQLMLTIDCPASACHDSTNWTPASKLLLITLAIFN